MYEPGIKVFYQFNDRPRLFLQPILVPDKDLTDDMTLQLPDPYCCGATLETALTVNI